jgi:hypothetical protein
LAELSHYQDSNPEHPEYEREVSVSEPRNVVIVLREVYKGRRFLH